MGGARKPLTLRSVAEARSLLYPWLRGDRAGGRRKRRRARDMSGWLRADRIQGSVSPGFAKDEQAFLWLRFPSASSARAWLKETVPQLTSAGEVLAFRALRAKLLAQSGLVDLRSTWVNVAFSRAGLDLLVPAPAGTFPEPFEQGMAVASGAAWRYAGHLALRRHARHRGARPGHHRGRHRGGSPAGAGRPPRAAGASRRPGHLPGDPRRRLSRREASRRAPRARAFRLPGRNQRACRRWLAGHGRLRARVSETRPERCRAPDRRGRGTAAISSSGGSTRTWPDSTRPSTS